MRCPGCGWEQPIAETCVVCGVRLTNRGETAAEARRRQAQQEEEEAAAPSSFREALPLDISAPLQIVRALSGAVTAGIATYIVIIQEGVVLTPMATLVVLAYGFVGVYWILSALMDISLRQFLMEMVAFLVATVGLRVNLPEAFDSEQIRKGAGVLSEKLRAKAAKGKADASKPQSDLVPGGNADLGPFNEQLQTVITEAQALLDGGVPTQDWLNWKASGDELRTIHSKLAAPLQEQTSGTLRKLGSLERAMESAASGADTEAIAAAAKALQALR